MKSKYSKDSMFYVRYDSNGVAKTLHIKFPEITGHIKDYDRNKY